MPISAIDICQSVESIWMSLLGLEVQPSPQVASLNGGRHFLTSCVHLTGGWDGAVTLECSMPLARQIASIMFSMEPEAASMEEIRDALGEMVSITGGNLKAILAGDCHLSLPTVAEGLDYRLAVPRSRVVARVGFECQSQPLLVTLLERDATGREVPGHNLR